MKTFTVCGIDPSSKKIAIVYSRRNNQSKSFSNTIILNNQIEGANEFLASQFIYEFCVKAKQWGSLALFLEAPVVGRGGPGATIPQAFVSGAILAAAHRARVPIRLVNNSSWKKRILGNGNLNKVGVSERMQTKWPALWHRTPIATRPPQPPELYGKPDQDILDAGALCLFGWHWVKMIERYKR